VEERVRKPFLVLLRRPAAFVDEETVDLTAGVHLHEAPSPFDREPLLRLARGIEAFDAPLLERETHGLERLLQLAERGRAQLLASASAFRFVLSEMLRLKLDMRGPEGSTTKTWCGVQPIGCADTLQIG
jgi:hypothetical protein